MNKKIPALLLSLVFALGVAACSRENEVTLKDTSKVLASVNGKNITQQQIDVARIGSTLSEKAENEDEIKTALNNLLKKLGLTEEGY